MWIETPHARKRVHACTSATFFSFLSIPLRSIQNTTRRPKLSKMMVHRFVLLLLFLTSSSLALKGDRTHRSRLLQQDVFERDTAVGGGPKEDESLKVDSTKVDKDSKDEKKDDKKDKKKCKKRKKGAKKKKESTDANSRRRRRVLQEENNTPPADDKDPALAKKKPDEPWCENESIKKNGNCVSLMSGRLPKGSLLATGKVSVELNKEDMSKVSDIEQVLQGETSLSAVGCALKRRLQDEAEDVGAEEDASGEPVESDISLLAYEMGPLSASAASK